jgi:endonuclease YncB( thermonuclease family)
MEDLANSTFENTKSLLEFNPKGTIWAKVLRVYDGDTFWAAYYNEQLGKLIKEKIRISRINAAEIRGKSGESSESKSVRIAKAKLAKGEILNFEGEVVRLDIKQIDKYGRIVADVLVPRENAKISGLYLQDRAAESFCILGGSTFLDVSEYMLRSNFAEPYGL